MEELRAWSDVLERYALSDEAFDELGTRLPAIRSIGAGTLSDMRPLLAELDALSRGDLRRLAETWADPDADLAQLRAQLEALAPSAASIDDDALLAQMRLVNSEGIVTLTRLLAQLELARELELEPTGADADLIVRLAEETTEDARELLGTLQTLERAGISDADAASEQFTLAAAPHR